jgi:hypothetical protein
VHRAASAVGRAARAHGGVVAGVAAAALVGAGVGAMEVRNNRQRAAAQDKLFAAARRPAPGASVPNAGFRKNADETTFELPVEIIKADLPMAKGLAWGWASIIEKDGKTVTDCQGDQIETDELVKAAHDFVLNSRTGGHMHLYKSAGAGKAPIKVADVVESMVFTTELQKALGVDLGKVGWLLGYQIHDPAVRADVASGKLKSLSIGGSGVREEIT